MTVEYIHGIILMLDTQKAKGHEGMQEKEKQSLRDWQKASRLTRNAFAKELKIDPRVLKTAMDGEPIHEIKAYVIVDGIRRYFERFIEHDKLPNRPEDIEGIVIYNPDLHRRSTAGIPQKRSLALDVQG